MDEDKVLDLPDQKPNRNKYLWLFISAVALMLLGYLFVVEHWPYGVWMVIFSTVMFIAYLILSFIERRQKPFFQYCYMLGKVFVIIGLNLWFLEMDQLAIYVVYGAFLTFVAGVVSLFIRSKN